MAKARTPASPTDAATRHGQPTGERYNARVAATVAATTGMVAAAQPGSSCGSGNT